MKEFGIKNIIIGIFVLAGLAGFLVFSGVVDIGNDTQEASGSITVWGDISGQYMQTYINRSKTKNLSVTYVEKNPQSYESDLINAFASGVGPDLFIMPHENLLRHSDKTLEIPFTSFPRDQYEATYIDEARIFTTDTGILGLPITVDPMIMYYNKALISSAFILDIPEYWDELPEFVSQITQYGSTGEVSISGAALGTFDNVDNAKAIIATLIMQNGNPIVKTRSKDGTRYSNLSANDGSDIQSQQALDYYTSFARFGSDTYSWNEALIDSRQKFIAGEVALYFGRSSEVEDIRRKNPNLDFGISLFPQVRDSTNRITQGAMTGIGISKQSKNVASAIAVASTLAGKTVAGDLAKDLRVAPARKDLLRDKPDDAFSTLVFNSAIISRGWVDPAPERTSSLFRSLIRSINSGAQTTPRGIRRASTDLDTILDETINKALENIN